MTLNLFKRIFPKYLNNFNLLLSYIIHVGKGLFPIFIGGTVVVAVGVGSTKLEPEELPFPVCLQVQPQVGFGFCEGQ